MKSPKHITNAELDELLIVVMTLPKGKRMAWLRERDAEFKAAGRWTFNALPEHVALRLLQQAPTFKPGKPGKPGKPSTGETA